jgi:hypothetical protein
LHSKKKKREKRRERRLRRWPTKRHGRPRSLPLYHKRSRIQRGSDMCGILVEGWASQKGTLLPFFLVFFSSSTFVRSTVFTTSTRRTRRLISISIKQRAMYVYLGKRTDRVNLWARYPVSAANQRDLTCFREGEIGK